VSDVTVNSGAITTLEEIIRLYGQSQPDKPLAVFDGRISTYGEVHSRSSRIASSLARYGVGEGTRVGLIAKNRVEVFEVLFATRKLGAVLVPVNWRLPPVEIGTYCRTPGRRSCSPALSFSVPWARSATVSRPCATW
jgi:acyl-CoA synthetase (AMP-forming)/AMP-acid ligase II